MSRKKYHIVVFFYVILLKSITFAQLVLIFLWKLENSLLTMNSSQLHFFRHTEAFNFC